MQARSRITHTRGAPVCSDHRLMAGWYARQRLACKVRCVAKALPVHTARLTAHMSHGARQAAHRAMGTNCMCEQQARGDACTATAFVAVVGSCGGGWCGIKTSAAKTTLGNVCARRSLAESEVAARQQGMAACACPNPVMVAWEEMAVRGVCLSHPLYLSLCGVLRTLHTAASGQ